MNRRFCEELLELAVYRGGQENLFEWDDHYTYTYRKGDAKDTYLLPVFYHNSPICHHDIHTKHTHDKHSICTAFFLHFEGIERERERVHKHI